MPQVDARSRERISARHAARSFVHRRQRDVPAAILAAPSSGAPFDRFGGDVEPTHGNSSGSEAELPMSQAYVERVVNLVDPSRNVFFNGTHENAVARLMEGDGSGVASIEGQFAIVGWAGKTVRMARTIGRPVRYFLAKRAEGPCLIMAERMDEIAAQLRLEGLEGQFHPSYTRMAPAHYVTELTLLGCPDPNPEYRRFFAPARNRWAADIDQIGARYIGQVATELDRWLNVVERDAPIGLMFSGGIDSGALLVLLEHVLTKRGESPARLKAFTLAVDGDGDDVRQARDFLRRIGRDFYLEEINVPRSQLNSREAVRVIEDYKRLDVEAATMGLALCRGIRQRYPDWRHLVDGDGGDENLKDYPIEENPELTIRSVLNNSMLYHEGWGVDKVKHSLTYSGGQSRGHVRTWAPAVACGFLGFSPYALPSVIAVSEGIPFIELTDWSHAKLYELKGQIVRSGVRQLTGVDLPVYEKRRFQRGAASAESFAALFPNHDRDYRQALIEAFMG